MRVTKRSGRVEDVKFDNVTNRISKLTEGLSETVDVTKIAQQVFSSIYDGIKTPEIDTLSAEICIGMITSDPDYEILATRITASNIQKRAANNFHIAMRKLHKAGIVTHEVLEVSSKVKDDIKPERDFEFGYFGLKTLEKGYLQKIDGEIIETPQYMYMRVAIGIHGHDIDHVLETYEALSKGLFIHATPTLFNAGTPRPQMSSCFLIANKEDSIDGIYDTVKECARISKWAGGIGLHIHDVRANKSHIRGTNGTSDGIIPMLRVYNTTARYVNQAGRRKGSIAVYLEPWHADILDFLEIRLNQGDEEARCRDLFSAMWIPDLFMKRVESDGNWSLFCPDVARGLSDVYGKEFEELYEKYEADGIATKVVPASEVWKAIIKSQSETGTPYMLYKDACNEKSNHKHLGTIKSSNLCVAPETKILTSKGQQIISELVDQDVEVWNGDEFSNVTIRQTGKNQKLLTVKTSKGLELRCTPYHKFWIVGHNEPIEAQNLEKGMKIIKHSLPVINHNTENMKYAYTHGLFCADGTTSSDGEQKRCMFKAKDNGLCMRHQKNEKDYEEDGICQANSYSMQKWLDLYHVKKELIKFIDYDYANNNDACNKIRLRLPKDIDEKYTVPTECSLESKLEWFAGLIDGDGCVTKHQGGRGISIQIGSIHYNFLNDVLLMLQTIGVNSRINL